MNRFINSAKKNNPANITYTENGAYASNTTTSKVLDLFGVIGSLRTRSDDEIIRVFEEAFFEDPLLAMKTLFYARNIRGGLKEVRTFRVILNWLGHNHPDIARKNIENVAHFGRFDDLYWLVGTPVQDAMFSYIGKVLADDIKNRKKNKSISLLAKWLKSTNTSSKTSVLLGKMTAEKLGYKEREYRKILADLRSYLNVVEVKMSANEWDEIEYSHVPAKAMHQYTKNGKKSAFPKHDPIGFSEYLNAVEKGEKKIHADTLFPGDILKGMGLENSGWGSRSSFRLAAWNKASQLQWDNLPNYLKHPANVVCIADTSGSMTDDTKPINHSLGLSIYFAERNTGPFENVFMTFSSVPNWVFLSGQNLQDKVRCIPSIVSNTDLKSAFRLVLDTALKVNLPPDEMPVALVVLSDEEIDSNCTRDGLLFHDAMKAEFAQHGYKLPNVIYWNLESKKNVFHAFSDYKGVQLVSGYSASVFTEVMNSLGLTPYEAMLNTLYNSEYDCVVI